MKKYTNKELMEANKNLSQEIKDLKVELEEKTKLCQNLDIQLHEDIKRLQDQHQDFIDNIFNLVTGKRAETEIQITSAGVMTSQPRHSQIQVFSLIGELIVYKSEFEDLKDRYLAIPKSVLMEKGLLK